MKEKSETHFRESSLKKKFKDTKGIFQYIQRSFSRRPSNL